MLWSVHAHSNPAIAAVASSLLRCRSSKLSSLPPTTMAKRNASTALTLSFPMMHIPPSSHPTDRSQASTKDSVWHGPHRRRQRMTLKIVHPDLTAFDTAHISVEMVYCIIFLVGSAQRVLDVLSTGTNQCSLARIYVHDGRCGLQCIPSFIDRLSNNSRPVRFGDTLTELVKNDGAEEWKRTTADWRRILHTLIRYFVREADPSYLIYRSDPSRRRPVCGRPQTTLQSALSLLRGRGEDVTELEGTFREGVDMLRSEPEAVPGEWIWEIVSDEDEIP